MNNNKSLQTQEDLYFFIFLCI